jgi:hypothetical protein
MKSLAEDGEFRYDTRESGGEDADGREGKRTGIYCA